MIGSRLCCWKNMLGSKES